MPAVGIIIAIVAVLGVGIVALNGNDKPTVKDTQNQSATTRSFATIQNEIEQGAMLLDVRTPGEYSEGHFANSTLLPLQDIQEGKLSNIPKQTKLYVHCRSGNRSAEASSLLKSAGYTDVIDLGGLSDVQAIGGTLQR